jgi:oligopeptide transport system substrate-binding protein
MPVHRKTVETYGARWTQPEHFVGNGPFVLKEWVPQSHILLVRNPRFHEAASVKIDRIRWLPDADANTEFQRFRAGEMDIARVPVQQLAWCRANFGRQLRVTTQLASTYVGLNAARPPFADNPKLREALALSMDQRVLNEVVAPEGNVPAFGFVPPGITQYRPQSVAFREQSMMARLERARRLYAEAGFGPDHPLAFELSYWNEPNSERRLAALASMWKRALGAQVTLVAREWQVFIQASRNHDFQAEILRWYADYSDPYTFLETFRSDAGDLNDIAYANPAYDALLDESQATLDPTARMALLERAEALLLADGFVLPDHFLAEQTLISDRIAGWQDNPMAFHPSRFLSIVAAK